MRLSATISFWTVLMVLCLGITGCQTVSSSQRGDTGQDGRDLEAEQVLPLRNEDFSKALAHFGAGIIHEMHSETALAASNYVAAIESDPDNDDLYFLAAERLARQKKTEDALAIVQRLIDRKPDSAKPYLWRAWLHQTHKQNEEAREDYLRALSRDPDNPDTYIKFCYLLLTMDRDREAMALLGKHVGRIEDSAKLFELLGKLHKRMADNELDPALAAEHLDKAVATYRQAIKKYPERKAFHFQLAQLYAEKNDIKRALEHFRSIEKIDPDNLQIKERLATSLASAMGNQPQVIAKLKAYLEQHEDDGLVHYYQGVLLEREKKLDEALVHYQKSAELKPVESAPYWRIAVLQMAKDLDQSRETLLAGLKAKPDDPRILEMLAYVHLQTNEYQEAVGYFERVDELVKRKGLIKNTESFHFNYAVAAQLSGDTDTAIRNLLPALEADLDYLGQFTQRLLQQKGDRALEDGITTLKAVFLKIPDEPIVQIHLGLLHNYAKKYAAALSHFDYAERMAEDHPEKDTLLGSQFYFWFGAAAERSGDLDRAEKLFRTCLEKDPKNAEAYNYLAYMWAENNLNLDEAETLITKAMALEPKNGAFLDTKGWVLYMRGEYEKALNYLQQAAEIISDDPTVAEHLGDVFYKLDRRDKARAEWAKALEMTPDSETLAKKIADLDRPAPPETAGEPAATRETASRPGSSTDVPDLPPSTLNTNATKETFPSDPPLLNTNDLPKVSVEDALPEGDPGPAVLPEPDPLENVSEDSGIPRPDLFLTPDPATASDLDELTITPIPSASSNDVPELPMPAAP